MSTNTTTTSIFLSVSPEKPSDIALCLKTPNHHNHNKSNSNANFNSNNVSFSTTNEITISNSDLLKATNKGRVNINNSPYLLQVYPSYLSLSSAGSSKAAAAGGGCSTSSPGGARITFLSYLNLVLPTTTLISAILGYFLCDAQGWDAVFPSIYTTFIVFKLTVWGTLIAIVAREQSHFWYGSAFGDALNSIDLEVVLYHDEDKLDIDVVRNGSTSINSTSSTRSTRSSRSSSTVANTNTNTSTIVNSTTTTPTTPTTPTVTTTTTRVNSDATIQTSNLSPTTTPSRKREKTMSPKNRNHKKVNGQQQHSTIHVKKTLVDTKPIGSAVSTNLSSKASSNSPNLTANVKSVEMTNGATHSSSTSNTTATTTITTPDSMSKPKIVTTNLSSNESSSSSASSSSSVPNTPQSTRSAPPTSNDSPRTPMRSSTSTSSVPSIQTSKSEDPPGATMSSTTTSTSTSTTSTTTNSSSSSSSPSNEIRSSLSMRKEQTIPFRFIRATKGDIAEARTRWAETCAWRKELGMDEILQKPHPHLNIIKQNYPHYFHLRGKKGECCYYEKPPKINLPETKKHGITIDDLLRHYAICCEYMWNEIETGEEGKSIYVLDLEGIGIRDFAGEVVEFVKRASSFTAAHYPERSGSIFILNVPSWFSVIWNVVKPMVDDVTKKKITIMRYGKEAITKALMEKIDIQNIPPEYGGTSVELGKAPEETKFIEHFTKLNDGI